MFDVALVQEPKREYQLSGLNTTFTVNLTELKPVSSDYTPFSEYANIDPIGCCIGEKGSRIGRIITELNGEKLDIIKYDENKEVFIKNALAPAKNIGVFILDPKKQEALVIADGDDFSLALGKKGQNVRLAAILTGWKIDIKTETQIKEVVVE